MPDQLIQWTALFGMLAVALLFLVEARRWRAVDSIIGRRQRILRMWLVVLIEALFAMMIVGPMVTSRKQPVTALVYWTMCIVLGFAVVVLALLDLREVAKGYARMSRRMFRDPREDDEKDT